METTPTHPTYRFRRVFAKGDMPVGYVQTRLCVDAASCEVVASCDQVKQVMLRRQVIRDVDGGEWGLAPNRRIMPTRWALSDPSGDVVLQFDQQAAKKLCNPFHSCVMAILEPSGEERYRVVAPKASVPDQIVGVPVGDYAIMQGPQPVGRITSVPGEKVKPKHMLGKLLCFLPVPSVPAMVSAGEEHLLSPPAALALMMLYRECIDCPGE